MLDTPRLLLLVASILIIATIACGGDKTEPVSRPTTVEEYAARVCDPTTDGSLDGVTWKQAKVRLERQLDQASRVVPLETVEDYHFAALATMRATLKAIGSMDIEMDDPYNPYEVIADEDVLFQATLLQEADEALEDETRVILLEHGCNVEEDVTAS